MCKTNQHLKPCPFCGEAPKTMARPNNSDSSQFFACVVCYCGGYSSTAHRSASRPTEQEALAAASEAWNTRPAEATKPLAQVTRHAYGTTSRHYQADGWYVVTLRTADPRIANQAEVALSKLVPIEG